jgi:large subunit ribosomal protein L13
MATEIKRDLIKIDASGRSIGRVATEAAKALMGKNKPQYEPQRDLGDVVEIHNAAQVKVLGRKLEQKVYYHYSGYPGGMKSRQLKEVMEKDPAQALRRAIKNMLPKNRLQSGRMNRLKVYND